MKSASYLKCCTVEIMSPEDQVCDKTWDDYYPDTPVEPDMENVINEVSNHRNVNVKKCPLA